MQKAVSEMFMSPDSFERPRRPGTAVAGLPVVARSTPLRSTGRAWRSGAAATGE